MMRHARSARLVDGADEVHQALDRPQPLRAVWAETGSLDARDRRPHCSEASRRPSVRPVALASRGSLDAPHWSTASAERRTRSRARRARTWSARRPDPESEYLSLEYMDWKSGGDTNFAPVATADGELDCRGFWKPGEERPDKGGRFTINARAVPDARRARSSRSAPTSGGCA